MRRRSAESLIVPLLALAMALLSFSQPRLGNAASQSNWRFGLVDDWGLPVTEARAYLYNSTASSYSDWKLIGWGDADGSGNVTFVGLPSSWDASGVPGTSIEYRLVVKMKINGSPSPITLGNVTALSLPYAPARTAVNLGSALNGSAAYALGPYGLPPNQWGRFRLGLFYVAFKAVDERGYPLPVTEVYAGFCSEYMLGPSNGTLITNEVVPPWIDSPMPLVSTTWGEPITNGSCGGEFGTLDPLSPNTGPAEFGGVGWIIVRIPGIRSVSGADSSLVKNVSLILKYRGTVVGNFTATRWLSPAGPAWASGTGIDGRLDPANRARTLDAELQANGTHVVVCSVRWVYVNLCDQNRNGWPTRDAKLTLYDYGAGSPSPWPGTIVPTDPYTPPNFNPSSALVRYPSINTSVKVVVTWYDVTVNVTLFRSGLGESGGMMIPGRPGTPDLSNPSNSEPNGVGNFNLYSDMVRVRLKLLSSGQLPAPIEPNEVDEIEFQLKSGAARTPSYYAKLSYWHGYVAIPDSPLARLLASPALTPLGIDEMTAATGWLPNGSRSMVDVTVRCQGSEVLDTSRGYPINSTIYLRCPGFVNGIPIVDPALTDYDRTLALYAGIYDVGFKVLLGNSRANSTGSEVALLVTLPGGERRTVWTDGNGIATLRSISAGNYSGFVILYKMRPLSATNVGPNGVRVDGSSGRVFELLFPAYDLNLTVWDFHRTFKLINVNVSLYSTVNLSQYGITNEILDRVISSHGNGGNVLPEGWEILRRLPSGSSRSPIVQYRTNCWSTNSTWPLAIRLLPFANYTIRVSVPNGSGARGAGFRDVDSNATLYWSMDPWGRNVVLDESISVDVRTYVYDARITTLDASGIPLYLFENSAIILAEPHGAANGTSGLLWRLQQEDAEARDYNAYLVRFNSSATNVFHSFNASRGLNDSDLALMNPALNYPQQSRYLIGSGNLSSPIYRFIVYYRGVLVFNGSMKLSNPYVSEESALITSAYHYAIRIMNDPPSNNSFTIPNLRVDVLWAGLRTSYWPSINLTRGEAIDEFALLNSTKLSSGFDASVVERMWGPPPSNESISLLPHERFSPYFSSYIAIEGCVTDANGEVEAVIPVWNDSGRIFGTPAYVNVRTVPGITAGVPSGAGSALVGMVDRPRADLGDPPWSGWYPPWQGIHSANLTGLVDNSTASAFGLSRSKGIGLLPNGTRQSPIIVRVAANDLIIIVKDASGNALPHQRLDIVSDALALHMVLFTGSAGSLSLSSSRSFIFWGAYGYVVTTANVTDPYLVYAWQLYGIQWLARALVPTWSSQALVLQWPAQLTVQVFAGDGATPIERAWVLLSYGTNVMVDGNTGEIENVVPGTNVTASMTDAQGFAGGIVHTEKGTVPLSLNVFRATYLVRIYYSVRGSPDIVGPVRGLLIYDSFTDEPQHRYLYLGIEPPDASGVDWSPAQYKIVRTGVWSLRVRLISQSGRAIEGARVRMAQLGQMYDLDPISNGICSTTPDGNAWMGLVPAGPSTIEAEWRSPYSSEPTEILRAPVSVDGDAELTLRASVHDLDLKLVGQGGDPIAGAQVSIAAFEGGTMAGVGVTDADGIVRVLFVPEGKYRVEATWYGVDVSPGALVVSSSRTYVLTAKNVGKLVVHVTGVLGQGLSDSQVEVWKGGDLVLSGKANGQGYVTAILPFGEYYVSAGHGGLEAVGLATLGDSSAAFQVSVGEFATLFGMGLTPISTAVLFVTMAALVLAISILIHEYVIWRRKRIPQLFR